MSHQLRLHGSKKTRDALDSERVSKFLRGQVKLAEAVGVTPKNVEELRAQLVALYEAAKWDRVIDVGTALAALGKIEPFDAVMLARAHRESGDGENAARWGEVAEQLLAVLEDLLAAQDGERSENR